VIEFQIGLNLILTWLQHVTSLPTSPENGFSSCAADGHVAEAGVNESLQQNKA
jgi:hypothetical protein